MNFPDVSARRVARRWHYAPHSSSVWLETLVQDTRIAIRLLRRTPLLSGIAVFSIALGVGTTAVVFAAIQAILLRPLPYVRVGELVQLRSDDSVAAPSHGDWLFWNDAQEIARRTRTLQSVAVYGNAVLDLSGDATTPPIALYGQRISANLFPVLGVAPMFGRNILPEEDRPGQPNEMILSYGLWERRFQADRSILGRTVRVNGRDCLVIGVMPRDFNFPPRRGATHTPAPYVEFWWPMRMDPKSQASREGGLQAIARLRSGISRAEAQQDLSTISNAMEHDFPDRNRDRTLRLAFWWDRQVGSARQALWFLMAAALMFLLIGCANVANLLLARGVARQREISVRIAIGAPRGRIVRQLLTESCVLAVLGGLGGYLFTVVAWRVLPSWAPVSIPRLSAARADLGVFAFAIGLAVVNGLLFGILPALRSAGSGAPGVMQDLATRGAAVGRRDRTRALLVMSEVAIAVALVLIGGQLLASFLALVRTDPGFQAKRVLASVVLPAHERYRSPQQRRDIYRKFLNAVRGLPGVEKAGVVDALPFSGENHGGFISVSPDPTGVKGRSVAEIDVIGGEYLQALGVRLEAGRWFREEEMTEASDAALVNEAVAKRLWPNSGAVGKRMCVDCTPENPSDWKRVVGVVSSLRHADLDASPGENVYLCARALESAAFLVVRTERPMGEMEKAVRRAIASVDPDQPVLLSTSMQTLLLDTVADRRFLVSLLTATGCLALLMALAGIFGVTAYTTSRRTQEIGIRLALGATAGKVHRLVFRQSFVSVAGGLAVGLVITEALLRGLQGVLVGLNHAPAESAWLAAMVVLVTAALACWIPARRATKIDPMSALRAE